MLTLEIPVATLGPPKLGFDWSKVVWGGPRDRRTTKCSFCRAELKEDEVPLALWTRAGACAEFCSECQKTWWGLELVEGDT